MTDRWIDTVSEPTDTPTLQRAKDLVAFAAHHGSEYGVRFVEARKGFKSSEFVVLEIEVDRPQERKADIKRKEPIAVVAQGDDRFLTILALREDFPFTPHQNAVPDYMPRCLCTDDRPWPEAKLTWSSAECVRRIRNWLERAARGELNNPAQPLEPLFYSSDEKLILPRAALEQAAAGSTLKLVGKILPNQEPHVAIAVLDDGSKRTQDQWCMIVLPVLIPEQSMAGIHRLPSTLGGLIELLKAFDVDLLGELRKKLAEWVSWSSPEFDSLSANLGICAFANIVDPATGRSAFDARAFVTTKPAGDVGVALGCLLAGQSQEVKGTKKYVPAISPDLSKDGQDIRIEPLDVHLDFDRIIAADVAGRFPDLRRAVMIGAGAVGSHVAMALAREGAFQWTFIDNDVLLPHNLARHALPRWCLGMRKAPALARHIVGLLGDTTAAGSIACDYLAPTEPERAALDQALKSADLIIDASASVAVERNLSDATGTTARRMSVFFNPAGTAAILLSEGKGREITLRDLEARYYHLLLTEPALEGHLEAPEGVRYSGSCRTLTNRIPARAASVLSGLLVGEIASAADAEEAAVVIWHHDEKGIERRQFRVEAPSRKAILEWHVSADAEVVERLRAERLKQLPNETGGVLLGIVDFAAKSINVVHALSAPPDSAAAATGFERGVQGLADEIKRACGSVLDQIRYVGEWHSHPRGASPDPSQTDLGQMCWLSVGLVSEGCPAVMLIVGETGESINLGLALDPAARAPEGQSYG